MSTRAEGWFIRAARPDQRDQPAELMREWFELPELGPNELLLEPLYGCWEANMTHALERSPVDVVVVQKRERAIIGNAGVARVLKVGREVRGLREGQQVLMFGLILDRWGYVERVMGYDAPIEGFLATRMILRSDQVIPMPAGTRYSPAQWAAFNNRYATAWANWRLAYGTFRLQLGEDEYPCLNVWSWGGGTGLAELQLAAALGHRTVFLASREDRLALARSLGVEAVDRRPWGELDWDAAALAKDPARAQAYAAAEKRFLTDVHKRTNGDGVQIFIEMIGRPVFQATTKALGRHGVLATSGWKEGMELSYRRGRETLMRHQFIHTHYCRRQEAEAAMAFGEQRGWMPIVDERVYNFDEVPQLAQDYAQGRYRMFPIYRVNPE